MEQDPEIIKLPDAILANLERRCGELQAFNVAIDRAIDGPIKELLGKPNFRDLAFYNSEVKEKFLNIESAFFRAFTIIFAFVTNHAVFNANQMKVFSELIDKKQLGTAEQPWNDHRLKNSLRTDQSITPAIKYILRIQAAFLRNIKIANEFAIAELSRVIQAFKMPVLTAKANFRPYRLMYSQALKNVVNKVHVAPESKEVVASILAEAGYTDVNFDEEAQTWTARLYGKSEATGSWDEVLNGMDPINHRLFIQARRNISARKRLSASDED